MKHSNTQKFYASFFKHSKLLNIVNYLS